MPDISDYDRSGYDYTKYWIDRQYEDFAEKRVLQKLLPQKIEGLLDLGGSFGRLAPIYTVNCQKATVLDFSKIALEQASRLAQQANIHNLETVWGDAYNTPFPENTFQVVLLIRVLHHIEDVPRLFAEVYRILKPGGVFIIEMANKIHLKSSIVHLAQGDISFRKDLSPIELPTSGESQEPGIFYNFHPLAIRKELEKHFVVKQKISANNLRLPPKIKQKIPVKLLLVFDEIIQPLFTRFDLGPSVWFQCVKKEL